MTVGQYCPLGECVYSIWISAFEVGSKRFFYVCLFCFSLPRRLVKKDYVEMLLDAGADINLGDGFGDTPLHLAALVFTSPKTMASFSCINLFTFFLVPFEQKNCSKDTKM